MLLRDILLLQKREIDIVRQNIYVPRDYKIKELNNPIIKVIIGPRRAGKSFFILNELLELQNFSYLNFDDENLLNFETNEIIAELNSIYDNPKIIFIDEIQNLKKWELFINRLARLNYNIILTGSNSNLLSSELATHLTGRYISTIIFPFSFQEYLTYKKKSPTTAEISTFLNEYLTDGGFPEPLIKNLNYKDYLQTLFDSIIYKDIIKRYNIRYPQTIEKVVKFLLGNVGNLISFQKIKKMIGVSSITTLEKYLSYLESTFMIFRLDAYSYKIKSQIKSPKKYYIIDTGIITNLSFQFSPNTGKLFENIVAVELKKKSLAKKLNFYYYKTKQNYEIDFVIEQHGKVRQLIQVSYDINKEETKNREVRALLYAQEELECDNLLVITNDYEDNFFVSWYNKTKKIYFLPLWKWLIR